MAYALDRQHARLVRAYQRLKELYSKSLADRRDQQDAIRDLKIYNRELEKTLVGYDRASSATMGRLFASTQYAISHLVIAGDVEAAEKLSIWLDEMRERMRPVSDVQELVDLLEDWTVAARDGEEFGVLYLRTMAMIGELRGRADS